MVKENWREDLGEIGKVIISMEKQNKTKSTVNKVIREIGICPSTWLGHDNRFYVPQTCQIWTGDAEKKKRKKKGGRGGSNEYH